MPKWIAKDKRLNTFDSSSWEHGYKCIRPVVLHRAIVLQRKQPKTAIFLVIELYCHFKHGTLINFDFKYFLYPFHAFFTSFSHSVSCSRTCMCAANFKIKKWILNIVFLFGFHHTSKIHCAYANTNSFDKMRCKMTFCGTQNHFTWANWNAFACLIDRKVRLWQIPTERKKSKKK